MAARVLCCVITKAELVARSAEMARRREAEEAERGRKEAARVEAKQRRREGAGPEHQAPAGGKVGGWI
jgi:hypothetical protein